MIVNPVRKSFEAELRSWRDYILSHWPGNLGGETCQLQIVSKADGSPCTKVDLEIEERVVALIKKTLPGEPIWAEEGGFSSAQCEPEEICWFVDPIDGTWALIEGRPDFTILISRCVKGVPQLGCVYFPISDQFYWSEVGKGAYRNDQALTLERHGQLKDLKIGGKRVEQITSRELSYLELDGTAGDGISKLFDGRIDIYVKRLLKHRSWDLAAFSALVAEAGGVVSDSRGNEVRFLSPDPLITDFICCPRRIHEELLGALLSSEAT